MKRNQLKIGSVLSYVQMLLSIVIGLVYTPIMMRLLGQSEYGLYITVSSTITMLTVLNLGFNSSYIRYYAKYKKENDNESIYKLNGLFFLVFSILGAIALICGLFLTFNLELVFDTGLTIQEYQIARVLMLLLTVNLAISFPMSVFQSIISAHEKFIFLKLLGMVKTVVSPIVTLPILLLGYKSIAMVSISVALTLITDVIYLIYVIFVLKNKFIFKSFEKGIFKSLFVYTSFIAINLIVDQINWNIDKFLLGRFKGTVSVAIYSVGYVLYNYYMTFSTSISGVFSPRIHKIANETLDDATSQKNRFTELFTKVGRIQFLILSLLFTGIIFFGQSFVKFWAGDGYENSYYVALLLVIPATIPLMQNVGIEIQRALNKHQFRSVLYACMALINLVLSIFMCQWYGEVGAAVGTAISLVIANGLIMNIYYHKKCNINIIHFWKNILRQSAGLIIPIISGILICKFVEFSTIWLLLLWIAIYSLVYCISMFFLGMNAYERNLILKPIKRIFKR